MSVQVNDSWQHCGCAKLPSIFVVIYAQSVINPYIYVNKRQGSFIQLRWFKAVTSCNVFVCFCFVLIRNWFKLNSGMQNFFFSPYKQTSVTVVTGQQQCLIVLQYRLHATATTDMLAHRQCLCNYCHCLMKETEVLRRTKISD